MIFEEGREATLLLIHGSRKAIPFNIFLSLLLALDLRYNHVPILFVGGWFLTIVIISLIRWYFCGHVIKNKLDEGNNQQTLMIFSLLTLAMGVAWGSCYLISLPYVTELHEFIIILVFGGMCAGSIASLSVYLPAYYAYIFPMFLPVIIYNYSLFNTDRIILATMFSLFVVMVIISAKINKKLLDKTFMLSHDLHIMSITDSLTGLYNRRYFEEILPKELNRAKRNRYSLNLIYIDVDNFKLINDNFGHPYGDKFLIGVGDILKNSCRRANDILFRLGGDEFSIILVNQSLNDAISICNLIDDQFRNNQKSNSVHLIKNPILDQTTLSMGIVNIHFEHSYTIERIISMVDKALYQAKKMGKNRIISKTLH